MQIKWIITLSVLCASCVVGADDKQPAPMARKTAFTAEETVGVGGTVLAVTKDSILLAPEGKAPIVYAAHDCLAAGKVHSKVRAATSYLLSDLKAGDIVSLDTIVENKQTFCTSISIWERPGGLVPPGQIVEKNQPYHEVRNARIALRDKGTPIPDHLNPVFPTLPKVEPKK